MIAEDNKNFYPTKEELVFKMLDKISDDFYKYKYILEPSAGKGNIIDSYFEYYDKKHKWSRYRAKAKDAVKFDAVELDENLNSLLRGKGINVVWDDFTTFNPPRFYDLIIMNPPFGNNEGCEHLLKAIKIQERMGGVILCLLNAETLKNPYSNNRKQLLKLIDEYKGEVEYIENAFTDAERKTDVEIALIYIKVPMTSTETMFERNFKRENPNIQIDNMQNLVPNMNKLEKLVFGYNIVKDSSLELFKEYSRVDKLLHGFGVNNGISICDAKVHADKITANEFIANLSLQYWNKFIEETDFKNRLPSKLRDNFTCNMEKQRDIAFNIENVRYFYNELINSIPQSYEESVGRIFSELTNKYCYSDSVWNKNIHMYSGWKTNKAYKIEGKNIIPCYNSYSYRIPDVLRDLNIIFENISGIKDNIDTPEIREAIKHYEKKIETKHFILDSFKKQTLHITYKNKDDLRTFNILASKGLNFLPPDFGSRKYENADEEYKNLIKEFGLTIEEYNALDTNKNNYLLLE